MRGLLLQTVCLASNASKNLDLFCFMCPYTEDFHKNCNCNGWEGNGFIQSSFGNNSWNLTSLKKKKRKKTRFCYFRNYAYHLGGEFFQKCSLQLIFSNTNNSEGWTISRPINTTFAIIESQFTTQKKMEERKNIPFKRKWCPSLPFCRNPIIRNSFWFPGHTHFSQLVTLVPFSLPIWLF